MQDKYSEMKKNSVSAEGQLSKSKFVSIINPEGHGKRIMLVGNSITRHSVLESIGWFRDCGMAASSLDKDYVHLLFNRLDSGAMRDCVFCITQAAEWERSYKNAEGVYSLYESAREFNPDVIVIRIVENCPYKDPEGEVFMSQLMSFISYLDKDGGAKVLITTGFWHHPLDEFLEKLAEDNGYPLVRLGDLGEDDRMKAIGLFEHTGVANHPGDEGMAAIAERIGDALEKML